MTEQQSIPTDEEAERELAEASAAFSENEGNPKEAAADMQVDIARTEKEETAKEYQDILIALGFTRYDNKEKGIAYKLKAGSLLIGRTFTEQIQIGHTWVSCLEDCEHGKKGAFLKRDECKQIPQVALFYRIRDGELPIPESTVAGKVVDKSDKAIQIQFAEFGQIRTEWWGSGALKNDEEGIKFIPASYSKETKNYEAKMDVPRDIRLPNYGKELEQAPVADITKEKDVSITEAEQKVEGTKEQKPEDRERGKTEHTSMDEVIKSREETIANIMKTYLEKGREMVEQIFPELKQPQLSELSQDIATSMFIEDRKEARKERW